MLGHVLEQRLLGFPNACTVLTVLHGADHTLQFVSLPWTFLTQCVAGLEMDLAFSENPSEIFRDACYIRNGDVPPFVVVLLSVSPGSD